MVFGGVIMMVTQHRRIQRLLQAKLDDARFCAIFNNPAFALDPTDPRFGQSAGAQELASAVAKCKQKQRSSAALDQAPPSGEAAPPAAANGKAGKPSGAPTLLAAAS